MYFFKLKVRNYIFFQNTFQAVLATDGVLSFILLSYELIEWDRCCGYNYPNIGFNSGSRSFSLSVALTPDAVHIEDNSNVGIKGVYMYRVDQDTILEPTNCKEQQSLYNHSQLNNWIVLPNNDQKSTKQTNNNCTCIHVKKHNCFISN